MDWKEKQAANRKLLEESQRGRNGRNMRNFEAETALAGVNRVRAAVCGKTAASKFENLSAKDAETAALQLLELFSTITDEEVIARITEGKKPKQLPKPAAEKNRIIQTELFNLPPRKLHFVLPYPPSANRYWRHAAVFSKNAGKWIATTYLSEEAKTYKETIRLFCAQHKIEPLLKDVVLTAYVYRPQRSGDLGNRLKVVEDALENIAYLNDSQIAESHHFRREDAARPRVEVFLEEVKL